MSEIRPFGTLADFRACVRLQEEVWGEGFSERVPVAILKVSQRLGGVASGAFDPDGSLAGFVFGMTGIEDGRAVHWSDMLAVRPGIRDGGLGRRLKMHQRDVLLERGVRVCYWTFDPLVARNAWLNLGRLGAVAREYLPDMYGDTDSPLHRGIGTDRFLAVWELDSDRVRSRLAGEDIPGAEPPPAPGALADLPRAFDVEVEDGVPRPVAPHRIPPTSGERSFLVPVPTDVQRLLTRHPDVARAWRAATRAVLAPALGEGAEVRELVRGDGPTSAYVVVRP